MTTREEKRFTAAVAAMHSMIAYANEPPEGCAEFAIKYADALIKKLEEAAPPVAEDKKCEHKFVSPNALGWQCTTCGEVLP